MAAPGVVGATRGVRLQSAAEIRFGKGGHLIGDDQLLSRLIEGRQSGTQLRKQAILVDQLCRVGIESTQRTEEDLAIHIQRVTHFNELSHLVQLIADACVGERRFQRRRRLQRLAQRVGVVERIVHVLARLFQQHGARVSLQRILCDQRF